MAVVILNYNGTEFLRQFLPSVLATQYDNLQIIVADNGSTDNSLALLKSMAFENYVEHKMAKLSYIALPENYGFAEGYNKALMPLEGYDYFVLLNSDVHVSPNWVQPVITLMESDKHIAVCQPKILAHNAPDDFEYAGGSGGWIDTFGYPFCRGRIFDTLETDEGQYDDPADIFWASGAAMFVKAELYKRLGGLDGDYFAHMEEIDFCWRVKKAHYRIMVCPEAKVWHVGGGTLNKVNSRKTFLNFRNSLVSVFKNAPKRKLPFLLFIRYTLDFIAICRFAALGEWSNVGAVFKANWAFVLNFPHYFKRRSHFKRIVVANTLKGDDKYQDAGWFQGSIVWAYFIRKKRTFSSLLNVKRKV